MIPACNRGDIVKTPTGRLAMVRRPIRDERVLLAYLSDDVPPEVTKEEVLLPVRLLREVGA